MPANSRTITYDALLSSTLDNYREKLIENIFSSSVFLSALKQAGGYQTRDGGDKIDVPLMSGKTVSGSAFTSGNGGKDLDPLSLLIPKDPTAAISVGALSQSTNSWWRSR